ncbi:MAG: phosphate ABC transporter permease PstA [Gemmataceae bacterium]|nr:phosphate ABC transporter permease PstA [Gemmataceae bacterium]
MSVLPIRRQTMVEGDIDLSKLERRLREPRTLINAALNWLVAGLTVLAMVPLFSVIFMLLWRGGQRLGIALFTELPPGAGMVGGGIGNALLGTVIMVGIATLLSVPVGILGGIYLAEFGPNTKTASVVRFAAKVLTGLPSVIAGVFVYALVVTTMGTFSALAGGVALSILMLPTIILTAEDAIRMVPHRMREAAIGMGCTQTQAILKVILPTARPGILTGVMLAVARAAGETAPLLFTALFSDYWIRRLHEPSASLAVIIYDFSGQPYPNLIEIAWAASLVLVLIVLGLNIAAQFYLRKSFTK